MALEGKQQAINSLIALFQQARQQTNSSNSDQWFAQQFMDIIDTYVQTGKIITTVITNGSSTTQQGEINENIQ